MRAYFSDKYPETFEKLANVLYPHVLDVPDYLSLELKCGDWELVSKKRQIGMYRSDRIKLINKKISRTKYVEFDIALRGMKPYLKTIVNDGYRDLELDDIVSIVETFTKG